MIPLPEVRIPLFHSKSVLPGPPQMKGWSHKLFISLVVLAWLKVWHRDYVPELFPPD